LVRYAYLGITDPKLRDKDLPALFISIAMEEDVPEGRDAEIHTLFFRARAVEGLGALCRHAKPASGESADGLTQIVETLLTILENKTEKSDAVRNNAMLALAELNLIAASAGGVKLDSERIVDAITGFARATCDRQQQFIDEVRRSEQASTSGGGMRGGMGGGMDGMSGGMGGMGGGMGGMGGGMGGMGGGMGGSGSDKMARRIEECIGSSKLAFGTVKSAIQGLSGGRNETSIVALLQKENAAANAKTVKMLADIQKGIDEYFNFLNKGPQGNRSRSTTASRTPGGAMAGSPMPGGGGGAAATARSANMPKVTLDDIYNELRALATKFDELKNRG